MEPEEPSWDCVVGVPGGCCKVGWGRGKGVALSVSMDKSIGVSRSPDESGWDGVNP